MPGRCGGGLVDFVAMIVSWQSVYFFVRCLVADAPTQKQPATPQAALVPVGPPQGALELQPAVYACGECQSPSLELDSFERDLGLVSP